MNYGLLGIFAPSLRPLLLLVDGHSSHYNPRVIKKAAEEGVGIFVLPPNTTDLIQSVDKGPFGPLKSAWKEVCREYLSKNPFKNITRFNFSSLFSRAWSRSMTMNNITAGFRVTGVHPLNRNAVIEVEEDYTAHMKRDTSLKYIPLFSPVHTPVRHRRPRNGSLLCTNPELSTIKEGDSCDFQGM